MLQIFAHADLSHQFVFVPIHSCQLANMSENILQAVGQLEGVHIVQAVLNVRIDNQFCQTQNLTAQMESWKKANTNTFRYGAEWKQVELTISETRFFTFFCRQCFHRLQIEVIIQMQIVQIFAMNQQIQHIVALATHLQPGLHPIERCRLKEFRRLERTEQIAFLLWLRSSMLQGIQHVIFQQLLITDTNFNRMTGRTVLFVPAFYQRHIECTTRAS